MLAVNVWMVNYTGSVASIFHISPAADNWWQLSRLLRGCTLRGNESHAGTHGELWVASRQGHAMSLWSSGQLNPAVACAASPPLLSFLVYWLAVLTCMRAAFIIIIHIDGLQLLQSCVCNLQDATHSPHVTHYNQLAANGRDCMLTLWLLAVTSQQLFLVNLWSCLVNCSMLGPVRGRSSRSSRTCRCHVNDYSTFSSSHGMMGHRQAT